MSKTHGATTTRNPDGTWRWKLYVPKERHQDYMQGFAPTEAEAEKAAAEAMARYERDNSN